MKKTKKILNLISLFVLVGSNVFTPLSYAISDFEENLESVAAEDVFETVGDTDDSTGGGESFNPDNSELTLDDSDPSNPDEGDSDEAGDDESGESEEEDEEPSDEDDKTQEETQDDENNTDEENQGDDESDDENLESDTTDGEETIQEETIQGEDNSEEEEQKEEKSELDLAWETLNEDPIIESKGYDGVTVSVEAPSFTFPAEAKLRILPVSGTDLDDVRQQILGEDSRALEDSLVAFNIQFYYELEDGTEIKLQPKDNKVEVIFNYSTNNQLKGSDIRALKVYHIADKQNEGEPVMAKKATAKSSVRSAGGIQELNANKEGDSLVVDATNFSIYAIIKTNIPESVTVNYDAGDGKFAGNIDVVTITYTLTDGDYIADKATQQPNQAGYSFKGWYTSNSCTTRWNGIVDDTTNPEITVYACYLPFSDITKTFGRFSFTMMNKNLGAENTADYGYLYQWGNNYGFDEGQTPAISEDLVATNTYNSQPRGPSNPYSSSNFISRQNSPFRWDNDNITNLWGGTSSNQEDWQGPCPDGYHVPNSVEWKAIYDSYIKSGYLAKDFGATLGLPMAGYRNNYGGGITSLGTEGRYWASNAYNNTESAYALIFTDSSANATDNKYRSYANSVRCFKNADEVTISFNSNEGSAVDDMIFNWYEPRTVTLKPVPTKEGISFAGWYYDEELTEEFTWANDTYITENTTLYAKWGCQPGYVLNANNECVLRVVRVNYMLGDELYKTMTYARNELGHYLPTTTSFFTPQKEGNWMFDQWYLDEEFTHLWKYPMDNDGLGETVTVYGRFLPFEDKTITINDLSFTIMDRNLGAKSASLGYNDSTDDNIGYYYQYGNNYGFPNTGDWDNVTADQVKNPISTSWGRTNPYSNGLFVTKSPWNTNNLAGLWGGYSTHTNPDSYKIGPCPEGYHIPEILEYEAVYTAIKSNKASFPECDGLSDGYCVSKVLGLPLGGYREGATSNVIRAGIGYYGMSTYYSYSQGYREKIENTSPSSATNNRSSWAGITAFNLRCFKDTDRYVLTFDAKGGTTPATQYTWWWKPYSTQTSTRYGSSFSGWYYDEEYQNKFEGVLTGDTTVYAKWECQEGFVMDDEGNCITDQRIYVTFKANPETFPGGKFSDGTTEKTIEYKGMSAGYFAAVNEEIQIPDLAGNYMFEGWYIDTSYASTSRWTGLSVNSPNELTLYARYLPFEDKTMTWDGVTFTMMDRNLGATDYSSGYSYGSSNEQSSKSKIGLYYQWGNNFGFTNEGAYPNTAYNILVERVSDRQRGPGNYYYNGTFIRRPESPYRWDSEDVRAMWGGNNESNPDTSRQGPCPDGYHVPYTKEWLATRNLFNKWFLTEAGSTYCASMPEGIQYCMPAALGLPFAGHRNYSSSSVSNQGAYGYYWSSTAYSADNAYILRFDSSSLSPQDGRIRAIGFSVRCFKDSPSLTLSFDSNGGSNVTSQSNFRWWQPRSSKPTNPTRANSNFVGWFTDAELTEEFSFSSTTYVSENTTLYAKWTCKDGYSLSPDGKKCEGSSVVTFNATTNGGTTSRPVASFRPGETVHLADYTATKPGWNFVGWNTSQTAKEPMDDFVIGNEGVRVYAIFNKELTATFKRNGNDSQTSGGNTTTDDVEKKCTIRNKETSCNVTSPTINSTVTRKILGYSNAEDNHEGTYGVNSTIPLSADITLYAQTMTDPLDRLITFNPNGNASFTYNEDTQTTATDYVLCTIPASYNGIVQGTECTKTIIFPTITPNGEKTVLGWSASPSDVSNLIAEGASQELVADKNLVYYAQSQSDGKTFTVTFYGNGATVSGSNSWQETCTIEGVFNEGVPATECDVDVPNIVREGFTILGFDADDNAQTATYSTSTTKIPVSSDKSFYAISYKPVSVKFHKNGNDSQTRDGQSVADSSEFVSESCPIRNKATSCSVVTPSIASVNTPTILGYSTSATGHNVVAGQNSPVSVSNNADYYAQSKKEPRTIYVSFYVNGNVGYTYNSTSYTEDSTHTLCVIEAAYNGIPQSSECNVSVDFPTISAPTNTPTVLGWSNSNTNHTPEYTDGQTATVRAGENKHYFAQTTKEAVVLTGTFKKGKGVESLAYTQKSCTIAAIYNGNDGNEQTTECDVEFPSFVLKAGYENPIWQQATLGDQNANTTSSLPISDNTTFTLVSTPIVYTINYDTKGGRLPVDPKTSYTVEDDNFTLVNPTKPGYTFLGWTGSNGDEPQTSVTVEKGTYGTLNYTANWNLDTYTITYDLDGGTVDDPNPEEYNVNTPNFTLHNPTKVGHTFAGWLGTNITTTPQINVIIRKGTVGDLEYTATYTKNPYVVTLDSTEGGSVSGDDTYKYGDQITVTATPDTGYHFVSWNDGEDVVTTDNPYVFTADETGGTGLTAVFELNEYEVNVDTNDSNKGTVTGGGTKKYGQRVTIVAHPILGYKLEKWLKNGVVVTTGDNQIYTGLELEVDVTDELNVTGYFVERDDTAYTVNYMSQNLDLNDDGYQILEESLPLSGTTDGLTTIPARTYEGLTLVGDYDDYKTQIAPDGSTVVNVLYNRNIYTITYDPANGDDPVSFQAKYGKALQRPDDPEKQGYTFAGWEPDFPATTPLNGTSVVAQWTPKTDTAYRVEYYYQLADGSYPTRATSSDDRTGTTDDTANVTDADKTPTLQGYAFAEGYSENVLNGTIAANGSLVLKVYFKKQYTVTYKAGDRGTFEDDVHDGLDYDSDTPSFAGSLTHEDLYIFKSWNPTIATKVTEDATYTAVWAEDFNNDGIDDTTQDRYTVTITYVYSRGGEAAVTYTTGNQLSGFTYNVDSPSVTNYHADKTNVSGKITGNVSETVTYTPDHDTNGNGVADEEETEYKVTVNYVYSRGGEASPIVSGMYLSGIAFSFTSPDIEFYHADEVVITGTGKEEPQTFTVTYTPNNDENHNGYADEEEDKYTVTITYVYSRGGEAATTYVAANQLSGFTYNIVSPDVQYYNADKLAVSGTITGNVSETVTYTPNNDENHNGMADEEEDKYKITVNYVFVNGDTAAETVSGEFLSGITYSFTSPVINHYTADNLVISGVATGATTFTVTYTANKYEVKFVNYDGTVLQDSMVEYGTMPVYSGETPKKQLTDGYIYVFSGWNPSISIVAGDTVYTAIFIKNSNNYSGGGGRNKSQDGDQHGVADEESHTNVEDKSSGDLGIEDDKSDYSEEPMDIYRWARSYNITTMDTYEKAIPNKYILRGHLAKMAVNYAVNVLGKEIPSKIPDNCKWGDDESVWESEEIKDYAEKSCALGIMGIKVKNFNPKKIVSRAEFGTVLSRILWGDKYNVENPTDKNLYYVKHLKALNDAGIMKDINNPSKRNEIRKRAWLMFRRTKEML